VRRARWPLLAILALLVPVGFLLLVTGWMDRCQFVDSDQPDRGGEPGVALEPGEPVGQTFVARHAGLTGIEFYLAPTTSSPLTLTLHLWDDPVSDHDLTTARLQLPPEASPGFHRFTFPVLDASHGQYYYAFIDAVSSGITVPLTEGAAYLDGAAYRDHQPLDAQTAFRLVYAPRELALDLAQALLGGTVLLAMTGLLFVVPGWALLVWLWPGRRLTWAETLGLAVGTGLALYPLLILWTDVVGLHLGPLYAWLPIWGGLVALMWHYRTWRPRDGREALRQWAGSKAIWPDLALVIVLALVFGVRLLVVRTLDAPMWGDSYQHTMIAQLLADNSGLFESWAPYAELESFTYHFGFHSAVAALHWIMGIPTIEATLWTGQLLNGLAVLAIYPLAVRVTGSRWGGVWAVLLAGLLLPLPMFYVNWGRYTQLAGQVILPAAVYLTWQAVETPQRRWRLLVLAMLVAGGLALTHYRVLMFYGVFVLALALLNLRKSAWRQTVLRMGCIGLGAGLLFLPWLINTWGSTILRIFGLQLTTPPAQESSLIWEYNAIGNLEAYLAPIWWLALALGLGVGLWRRQRGVLLVGLWWFLLLIATNPAWLSLPGTGIISNFALFVAVYLLAALLSGNLVGHIVRPAAERRWASILLALAMVALGMWGVRGRLGDPEIARHTLLARPDVRAAAWIRENTHREARFLVNGFFAYGGDTLVGSDGGWWLPLLAERQNTVPPINYENELGMSADYEQQVEELAHQVQEHPLDDPKTLSLLKERRVTHVYVGQQQGRVNYSGPDVLDPDRLLHSPHYRLAYHQDRVWIFEFRPPE
jgi:hypothetical protein